MGIPSICNFVSGLKCCLRPEVMRGISKLSNSKTILDNREESTHHHKIHRVDIST